MHRGQGPHTVRPHALVALALFLYNAGVIPTFWYAIAAREVAALLAGVE